VRQKKFDKIFEGEVTYFNGTAEFRQKVNMKSADFAISGSGIPGVF
jgi:hypothetical protein